MDDDSKLASFLVVVPFIVMVALFAVVLLEPVDSVRILMLVIAAVFFVLSAVMFTGKGAWIVASFDRRFSEETSPYDSQIVARGVGTILLGAGIMVSLSMLGLTYLFIGVLALIVLTFVGVIYIAKYSKG